MEKYNNMSPYNNRCTCNNNESLNTSPYNNPCNTYNYPCTCNHREKRNITNNESVYSPNMPPIQDCSRNRSPDGPSLQHGLVDKPLSRVAKCVSYRTECGYENAYNRCGDVINNSGGLEAEKGFPERGPRNGQIASAGREFARMLDEQTADHWWKNPLYTGEQEFTWHLHAPHSTDKFEYFITNPNWDPNQPLARSSFNLTPIKTEYYYGAVPPTRISHIVPIPNYYCGYHIILAVWTIADTPNAFYNVIDLCLHSKVHK